MHPAKLSLLPDQSSATPPIHADRRGAERQVAMLRLAKIKSGEREGWALVKNLSISGMMLVVHPEFRLERHVTVLLSEDKPLMGEVRWRQQSSVGIHFPKPVDVEGILSGASEKKNRLIWRAPRIQMRHPIVLHTGSKKVAAYICDISPTGLCVETHEHFEQGRKLTLTVPNLDELVGYVRWQTGARTGISLESRLPIDELMCWLSIHYEAQMTGKADKRRKSHQVLTAPAADAAACPDAYHVVGYDDLGRAIPVAVLESAKLALTCVAACARLFDRVAITNSSGVEWPLIVVMQHRTEELVRER
ncbi:MAG: PilZ domain-containing protein [Sphingomonadaceae bacterium]|nr:PilZ domain-containing protein [Sphingomonadaceae bacterium]